MSEMSRQKKSVYKEFKAYLQKNYGENVWRFSQYKSFTQKTRDFDYTSEELILSVDKHSHRSNFKPTPEQLIEALPRKRITLPENPCKLCDGKGVVFPRIKEGFTNWKTGKVEEHSVSYAAPCPECEKGKYMDKYIEGYQQEQKSLFSRTEEQIELDRIRAYKVEKALDLMTTGVKEEA